MSALPDALQDALSAPRAEVWPALKRAWADHPGISAEEVLARVHPATGWPGGWAPSEWEWQSIQVRGELPVWWPATRVLDLGEEDDLEGIPTHHIACLRVSPFRAWTTEDATRFPGLTTLDVGGQRLSATVFGVHPRLQDLRWAGGECSDPAALGLLTHLECLDLARSTVDAAELPALPRLTSLDVSRTAPTHLEAIGRLSALRWLGMRYLKTTPNLRPLERLAHLDHISAHGTSADWSVVSARVQALRG